MLVQLDHANGISGARFRKVASVDNESMDNYIGRGAPEDYKFLKFLNTCIGAIFASYLES